MSVPQSARSAVTASPLLVVGLILAGLTEAGAGTILSLGRGDIIGDIYATPDEFAWLDVVYTALKLIGFLVAPWLMNRIGPRSLMVGATLCMGVACGIAAVTGRLDQLVALRLLQGFSGGLLLVGGQAMLFLAFPRQHQPLLQALFAMGAVVAPATIAPALQGWLLDTRSWTWIFFGIAPLSLAAAGLILFADAPVAADRVHRRFDWAGLALAAAALSCLTYALSQGSRWDWFEEPRVVAVSAVGAAALLAFLARQVLAEGEGMLDFTLFRSMDFSFAFIASFVAGAALFGSAYLIPSFAVSVLAFTATDAGQLLLPSGVLFVGSLLVAAFLIQVVGVPPIATVPLGILMIMAAMWMLSGSTADSGSADMMPAILLRGFGLGFLFLSITLIAFGSLDPGRLAAGIGLFNTGRQLGGLIGVAALQTLIEHDVAANVAVLCASLTSGTHAVAERLALTSAVLMAKGMNAVGADQASLRLLFAAVTRQATVIAFDRAFAAVALLFVVAAPVLVAIKVGLTRHAHRTSAKTLDVRSQTLNGPDEVSPGDIATAARSTSAESGAT